VHTPWFSVRSHNQRSSAAARGWRARSRRTMSRDTYAQALPAPPASTAWESFLRIAGVTGRRLPAGRHVAHVHPQTVPVRWVNGDGEPEPVVLFVEPNSIDLE